MGLTNNVNEINKHFIKFAIPSLFIILIAHLLAYHLESNVEHERIRKEEFYNAEMVTNVLEQHIQDIITDLIYFSEQSNLSNDFNIYSSKYHYPAADWFLFSNIKKDYDQIRWIDSFGDELVRINLRNQQAQIVSTENLQNKSNRYYFTETMKLNRGEIYVSPMDLNIENGKIQQPYKPTLRVATPLFDKKGLKSGILIINYLGSKIQESLSLVLKENSTRSSLLNRNGYWMFGPIEFPKWGFMFDNEKQSMSYLYPKEWQLIDASKNGQFMNKQGLWTFSTIYPLAAGHKISVQNSSNFVPRLSDVARESYQWKLVQFMPNELYNKDLYSTIWMHIVVAVILALIIMRLSWIYAKNQVQKQDFQQQLKSNNSNLEQTIRKNAHELIIAKDKAEMLSRTDELTGMNNRRALFEYVEILLEQSKRFADSYTVLMLDVDHFDIINERYNHYIGDKALNEVAKAINFVARNSDISARYGGEEFVLFLPRTDGENARKLAERLRSNIANLSIDTERGPLKFTVSIGISELLVDDRDKSFKQLVREADIALYEAKSAGRNCVKVFKSQQSGPSSPA